MYLHELEAEDDAKLNVIIIIIIIIVIIVIVIIIIIIIIIQYNACHVPARARS